MRQLDDPDIGTRLRSYLASAFACPDAVYTSQPARIRGGFDAAIFGFSLDRVPPPLAGPLVLRLDRAAADPRRIRLESVVQNTLADMGFPAPRAIVTEPDPTVLGGPFIVMPRLSGRPLAHRIAGLGVGSSFATRLGLVLDLPAIFEGIIDQWVDLQIRLHRPAEPLLQSVAASGLDKDRMTFAGQLAQLRVTVEQSSLAGLEPGLTWLESRRPPQPQAVTICHGDFHPLNILADDTGPTGVVDWVNIVVAEPAMDVGSAIANIAAVPLDLPRPLRVPARVFIARALRRYEHAYRARRPLDGQAVRYYQVFRAVAQLVWVGHARAVGRTGGGAFHSAAGPRNLIALIARLSGLSLRL